MLRSRAPVLLFVSVVAWCSGGAALAAGAGASDASQGLFQAGKSAYGAGRYGEALDKFKEAYRLARDPILLLNIGHAYRRLDDPANAATNYRAYLHDAKAPANRSKVEQLITEQDAILATRQRDLVTRPSNPPEPPPGVGDKPPSVGDKPPASVVTDPGRVVTPPPPPEVDLRPPPPVVKRSNRGLWIGLGIGAALLAGGAVGLGVGLTRGGGAPDTSLGTIDVFR